VYNNSAKDGQVSGKGNFNGRTENGDLLYYECGMTVTRFNTDASFITVLDSESTDRSNPGEYDSDLGSPNESCDPGGVGIGDGGKVGEKWENCAPLGNVLILQDPRFAYPNDEVKGCMRFTFKNNVTDLTLGLLDIDNGETAKIKVCCPKNE
jgi:hypothetical protein